MYMAHVCFYVCCSDCVGMYIIHITHYDHNILTAMGGPSRYTVNSIGDRLTFERAEMQMIIWMCGISMKDRRTNEELRRLVGVEPITAVIRNGRLRWYGHVMRKSVEDWVKKCMEFRVKGRRQRTW